ncbi:MAG: 50S ribosomal protein L1 [Rhodospirillales bacterium]|jgi:large subunit ribosomal protein L1|nr:50S ribosomal protein L1 [Rhodospirillales bacterium]
MAKPGKRMRNASEKIEAHTQYDLTSAVKLVKGNATCKFDETIDLAVKLGVDPRHADQMVRGVVALPNGTGKTLKIAVFAKGDKVAEAEEAGADFVGAEELAEQIQKGTIEFDRCIATPDMMAVVGRLGKVLGPRGLMPNPKLGTVTMDIKGAIDAAKAGQIEFRVEKAGIIHAGVGKASFTEAQIEENVSAVLGALSRAKPSGIKGTYMQSVSLSSTMGPGVRINMAESAS